MSAETKKKVIELWNDEFWNETLSETSIRDLFFLLADEIDELREQLKEKEDGN